MKKFIRDLICFFFGCLFILSFAFKAEAYTTVDLGSASYAGDSYTFSPVTSKLVTDKSGVIWSASFSYNFSQGRWYLNVLSSNGNSGLSGVAGYNLGISDNWSPKLASIAVDGNNSKWIAINCGNGYGSYRNYIFEYNGSFYQRDYNTSSISFTGLGVDPSDGRVISAKTDKSVLKWSGSSWSSWPGASWAPLGIVGFITDYNNVLWAWSGTETAIWNGSSWVSRGSLPFSPRLMINPATGNVGAFGSSIYEYNGSNWVYRSDVTQEYYGGCYALDGAIINGYYDISTWGGTCILDTLLLSDGSIFTIWYWTEEFCTEGCTTFSGYTAKKYVFNTSSFSLTPSPNGATGQLRLAGQFDGRSVSSATIQYSTNGSSFSDLRVMQDGDGGVVATTANTYWFRLKWLHRSHPTNSVSTFYTNSVSVPTISVAPSIGNTTGIAQWDSARGRSWVNLTWGSITNASGYNLQIFDGNVYRVRNIGNVTSWNSQTAKVFPQASNLPENNTVSTDPFRWDGSGVNFEDTAARLYRSTTGTSYDTVKGCYFQVSAYNAWMESTPTLIYIELPNATDSIAPSGTISVTVPEGATAPATVTVNLSAIVDGSGGSGLYQMRFSNDNAAWSGWENFAASKSWTTSPGEGQKTVYAQIKDNVGNTTTFSVSFWLGATLTQIYNESQNSNQKAEASRQAAVDAKTSADAAKTSAQTASTNSSLAASNAQTAADRSYYAGKYGGNSESVADISGYMRNTQLPEISSKADGIQNAVNTINNTVTSINNTVSADSTAPMVSVRTLTGAQATSGSSINMVVSASDNKSATLTCSINGGAYQALPGDGIISVPLGSPGPNTITIRVRDEAGNTGLATIVIRKI